MKNHWTYYLHEAGSIKHRGQEVMQCEDKIDFHKKQLDFWTKQRDNAESEALNQAKIDWSDEEIAQAKKDAKLK